MVKRTRYVAKSHLEYYTKLRGDVEEADVSHWQGYSIISGAFGGCPLPWSSVLTVICSPMADSGSCNGDSHALAECASALQLCLSPSLSPPEVSSHKSSIQDAARSFYYKPWQERQTNPSRAGRAVQSVAGQSNDAYCTSGSACTGEGADA